MLADPLYQHFCIHTLLGTDMAQHGIIVNELKSYTNLRRTRNGLSSRSSEVLLLTKRPHDSFNKKTYDNFNKSKIKIHGTNSNEAMDESKGNHHDNSIDACQSNSTRGELLLLLVLFAISAISFYSNNNNCYYYCYYY